MKLSVIMPAYNEAQYLPQILTKVATALPDVPKEIIIVDDCSTDGTREWLRANVTPDGQSVPPTSVGNVAPTEQTAPNIRAIFHERNQGKGAAVRTGLRAATGDVFVRQDADLEYDPGDWMCFWPLFAKGEADVVFGSRF